MSFIRILLLLAISFSADAEPNNPASPKKSAADEIQVYTKESAANVEVLNKTTEILRDPVKALLPNPEENKTTPPAPDSGSTASLGMVNKTELPRDPTRMSGNFRQALKNINPTQGTTGNTGANAPNKNKDIPVVELVAKVMGKHKSVLLRFKGHTAQVFEGGQISLIEDGRISLVDNQTVVSFRVDKIEKDQVKISVLPYNAQLILR